MNTLEKNAPTDTAPMHPGTPDTLGTPDNTLDTSDTTGRKALNGTAYRIFKLLQWLIESPLNVETLNLRFQQEPLIGKAVSSDSIWLYINTLKTLGCQIR